MNSPVMIESLGEVIRDLMAKRGRTGPDVALAIGISTNALYALLNNRSVPRHATIVKLRNVLAENSEERVRLMRAYGDEHYDGGDEDTTTPVVPEPDKNDFIDKNRAVDYLDAKASSIAFRNDVSAELERAKITVQSNYTFDHMGRRAVADFITKPVKNRIVIETKANIHREWQHTLGTCIMLRKALEASAVVVVIPYYNEVALQAKSYFIDEKVHVVRIDELVPTLKKLGA